VRALVKLLLGETRVLPIGVALVLAGALVLHAVAGEWWDDDGGYLLLAGVVAALSASLSGRSGRRPR
jgi:hypothetical protein